MIASVDITVGIALFGGPPPAASTVWELSGAAAARLPRPTEEAQRSALIFAEKRMVVVRAERGAAVRYSLQPESNEKWAGYIVKLSTL